MKKFRAVGFTLIEMLVVVVIIALLSGILLKSVAMVQNKTLKAKGIGTMEYLSNALNEFNNEYGNYPPVSSVSYEREQSGEGYQTARFTDFLADHNDPNDPDMFFPDMRRGAGEWPQANAWGNDSLGYRYGLVSYLWLREQGSQPHWYDSDTERDVAAKEGWSDRLREVTLSRGLVPHDPPASIGSIQPYTNVVHSVNDPWGHTYRYICTPPFTRYRLWSVGPDGQSGTADDIDYEQSTSGAF